MDNELSNIYNKLVKPNNSNISRISNSSFGSPHFERDPKLINLENSVFSKIRELSKEHDIKPEIKSKTNDLKVVSYEEALKELLELEKASFQNSPIS